MTDPLQQLDLRKASVVDIDQLVALRISQLIDEGYTETADIRADLSNYFRTSFDNGSLICWVGVVEQDIVATGGICFYQLPPTFSNPTGKIAYVTNMYTNPSYRKRGVAALLLDKLIIEAKALDYKSVRLHASQMGKGVYEKAGFIATDGYMAIRL